MKELSVRIVSGVLLAVSAVAVTVYSPVYIFKLLISILAGLGSWEVFRLLHKKFDGLSPLTAGMLGFFFSLVLLFISPYLAVLLIFTAGFYYAHRVYSINTLTAVVFGFIYAVFFISSIAFLHQENRFLVLVLFATVWAGDTMAYFVGKAFGRHRLAPRLSPKKTWEGAFGSVAGSISAGGAVAYYTGLPEALIPVVIASVVMQVGDLFESFIKRQVGEKDSSHIIPGHGGILDRIDALIFASVVFVAYYQIINLL
ncbi:phosphatidate cytidylyltransferase [Persephonella sp.]